MNEANYTVRQQCKSENVTMFLKHCYDMYVHKLIDSKSDHRYSILSTCTTPLYNDVAQVLIPAWHCRLVLSSVSDL